MKFESLKGVRLQGIAKSIHKFFLIVTYPFRHSFKFLGFLIVGLVFFASIPMMRGVSFEHILDWYMLKYEEVKDKGSDVLKNKPEHVERKIKNAFKKEFKLKKTENTARKLVADKNKSTVNNSVKAKPATEVKRKTFKLGNSPFKHINVKNTWTKKKDLIAESPDMPTVAVEPLVKNDETIAVDMPKIKDELSYKKIETLPLIYEDIPEHIQGEALIFSANDLSVGNRYIILYGILTDSKKHDEKAAFEYLKDLADRKDIECDIVAYTYDHYATAVCFIDGKNINKNLVDAGFADNIAL